MGEADNDFSRAINSLRLSGADRFDPIALHYLEVLAHRTKAQHGRVKHILEDKLRLTLAAFEQRFEQSLCAAKDLAPLQCEGPRESLRDLTRRMAQQFPDHGVQPLQGHSGVRVELKSVRQFRNTWSKLSANKQVAQALDQAPKNAGPINSHMLVLRSLALMRDISPDYLNRFVSYVDTLLCLNQGDKEKQANTSIGTENSSGKKPKGRRAVGGSPPPSNRPAAQ
jgi:hypothetical protein